MALVVTFNKTAEQCGGSQRTTYGTVAMGTYPTTGEPFTARQFGLNRVYQLDVYPKQGLCVRAGSRRQQAQGLLCGLRCAGRWAVGRSAERYEPRRIDRGAVEGGGDMTQTEVVCLFCGGRIRYHWQLILLHATCKPPIIERAVRSISAPPGEQGTPR